MHRSPSSNLPRRQIALASTLLLIMVMVFATGSGHTSILVPRPALAAPCWDVGCNGIDPNTSGCANLSPSTVDGVWRDNPGVLPATWTAQLRYSDGCGANWGRALSGDCGGDPCHSEVFAQNMRTAHFGGAWGAGTHWTPMLSGIGDFDRVCGYADGQDDSDRDGDDGTICTVWH